MTLIEGVHYKIVDKSKSKLMRVLARVLFFNKTFMTSYITTIGSTIYAPGRRIDEGILKHELVHVADWRRYNILFALSYVLLLPAVFTMRSFWEKRAYAVSIEHMLSIHPAYARSKEYKQFIVSQFTSPNYLYMCPFKAHVEKWFDSTLERASVKGGGVA